MNKKEKLLSSVNIRKIRSAKEIKAVIKPSKTKKWFQKNFSFRTEDLERIEKIKSKALKEEMVLSGSVIIRAALISLEKESNIKGLINELSN